MSYKAYKTRVNGLGPAAIKLGQTEIHAPDHTTWGVVTCDACGAQFAIGPNRTYDSGRTERECVEQLETILAEEHKKRQAHMNSYELEG